MGWSYQAAVARIRERIRSLPDGGAVLVTTQGDEGLVEGETMLWHFPQTLDGFHAGLPADGAQAIAHLEELRSQGAGWLVFPSTSLWWLDHYRDLHRHLVERYRCISAPEHDCLVFRLAPAEGGATRRQVTDGMTLPAVGEPGLVSVVIACYNQREYVAEAIESVLAQTYPNVEIIFVDDGSTDRPYEEVVSRYPGIRHVWQENQGLAAARNRGLREARGAYVSFLDADDRLRPNALSTGLQLHYERFDHAFVAGHYCVIDAHGAFKRQWTRDPLGQDPYEALLRKNCIGMHGTVIYRRAVFDLVGEFDATLSACEDYDLYLRIARTLPISRHEEIVAEYREHATNMSNEPERMLETVMTVLSRQRQTVRGEPQLETALRAGISRYRRQYGRIVADEVGRQLSDTAAELSERARHLSTAVHRLMVLGRRYPGGYIDLLRRLGNWLQDGRRARGRN